MDSGQISAKGFDYAEALSRLGGNVALLHAVLASFLEINQSLPQQLPLLAQQQDWQAMRVLCHTLKGSAANISATRLSQAAANIESLIKQDKVPVSEPIWRECLIVWQELEGELNNLLAFTEAGAGKALSASELMAKFRQLLPLIDIDLVAADSLFIELKNAQVPTDFSNDFSLFIKQFDSFDLSGAKASLDRMLRRSIDE